MFPIKTNEHLVGISGPRTCPREGQERSHRPGESHRGRGEDVQAWKAKGWQGTAGHTWLADAGVALPLILADAVGRAGAGVAGTRHAAASLHPQGMAGLGQRGPGDAVTQSHTLQRR